MWNRKDVKAKGKASFKANFWKCVATAAILGLIGGGISSGPNFGSSIGSSFGRQTSSEISQEDKDNSFGLMIDGDTDEGFIITTSTGSDNGESGTVADSDSETNTVVVPKEEAAGFTVALVGMIILIVAIVFIVAMAIGLVFDAFLINPVELGCRRFFKRNLDEPAALSNLMFAFDSNYKNIVKTMFFRDLYIVLWSMLFVIPGIVKSYEYRMIPYILSDNPEMSKNEAFAESKRLMTGNKWKTFVLDLSFILWDLASLCTCGLAGIFYVNPYKSATDAALYEALKYGTAIK